MAPPEASLVRNIRRAFLHDKTMVHVLCYARGRGIDFVQETGHGVAHGWTQR